MARIDDQPTEAGSLRMGQVSDLPSPVETVDEARSIATIRQMKVSTSSARRKASSRTIKTSSPQRDATERVYRLTNDFSVRLQALEKSLPAKIEFSASPRPPFREFGSKGGGDIMALAFIVLMEAAKSSREDLKAIMDQVKQLNDAKQKWREQMGLANQQAASDSDAVFQLVAKLYTEQMVAEAVSLRDKLNSPNEFKEMDTLHLEMAMRRLSQLMSMLASLLKRLADASSQLTQNLK